MEKFLSKIFLLHASPMISTSLCFSVFILLSHSQVNCEMVSFQKKMEILSILSGI